MNKYDAYVGMKVMVKGGKFFGLATVVKINPKNIKVKMDTGGLVNAHPSFLHKPTEDELSANVESPIDTVSTVPFDSGPKSWDFSAGEIVRTTSAKYSGFYAVIAVRADKVNIAKLGGAAGQYVRCSPSLLKKVPLTLTDGDLELMLEG